jgi:hypothetical protein
VLPLLPFAAALIGTALAEAGNPRPLLACCAILLVAFPVAAALLPSAVGGGLSHSPRPPFQVIWLLPIVFAAAAWTLDARGRHLAAVFLVAAGAAIGMIAVKVQAGPQLDRQASARELWSRLSPVAAESCVAGLTRNWLYSLNYYSTVPLPACTAVHSRYEVRQNAGGDPYVWVDPAPRGSVPSHFRY